MTHPFDVLALDNGASFIFTPCPGTQEVSLADSVATLKAQQADAVISLLSDHELDELGVPTLGQQITAQGMAWYQLPIEDFQAPEQPFFDAFLPVKDELLERLSTQQTIVIHCRGGSGRTGLMAAILLLESGQSWAQVKPLIQGIRPKALTLEPHVNFFIQQYSI
ncbi:hypothetical protein MAQ5080_01307 [Marinomonas aquimarina]|uniref:Tyrosine specific protein phosphatases domain-containing protein n=1 Tax=Marinomonas aquimarina TaxID=295068 RepID=A0A1A8TAQ3_9GAMM|nr:tyrosine-protein phosphatase [Marinomonas aquimarina]SBS29144.1 hypothetical protein MAQ5080_01307 [Marinomonas aquimarina]